MDVTKGGTSKARSALSHMLPAITVITWVNGIKYAKAEEKNPFTVWKLSTHPELKVQITIMRMVFPCTYTIWSLQISR